MFFYQCIKQGQKKFTLLKYSELLHMNSVVTSCVQFCSTILPDFLNTFLQSRLIRKNEEVILCMLIDAVLEIMRKKFSRAIYWSESTVHL
jgi:hypothetical protein